MLTRATRIKTREGVIEKVEKYGIIQNVLGNRYCGFNGILMYDPELWSI